MSVAILTARSALFHPNRRLLEAARALGVDAKIVHPKELYVEESGGLYFKNRKHSFEAVLVRIGSTINPFAMALIRSVEENGIRVISRFRSIELAKNKFLSLIRLRKAGIAVPKSYFVSNKNNLWYVVYRMGGLPVVLKAPSGRQGEGVWLVKEMEEADTVIEKVRPTINGMLVQEFLGDKKTLHLRCLVVGGKVLGTVSLIPKRGEFRANVHMGARAKSFGPDPEIDKIALTTTSALGLEIAGVDMIEYKGRIYVLEANYSPGFRGFEKATGVDVAGSIMNYIKQQLVQR